jgi:ribose-phosphate pyrophosphokinase
MDLFIVQDVSNHYPLQFYGGKEKVSCSVNDHMICLITAIDAAKQAGAESVTVVVPAYPYSRQHKKKGREGLTASRFWKDHGAPGCYPDHYPGYPLQRNRKHL